MVRSPNKILQQIINHVYRSKDLQTTKQNIYDSVKLSSVFPNNYYFLNNGQPIKITKLKTQGNETFCEGLISQNKLSLFDNPFNSFDYLGICVVNVNDFSQKIKVNSHQITGKFVCLPTECDSFYTLTPLLHSFC